MTATECVLVPIEKVTKGDFVRLNGNKVTYVKRDYCKFNKAWELQAWEDANKFRYVKKGKLVQIGFDY